MELHRHHPFRHHLFFFFFLVFSIILPTALSDFTPATNILLNCGTTANATQDVRSFIPDSSHSNHFRLLGSSNSLNDLSIATANNPPSEISHTTRVFTAESAYEFTVQTTGTHFLRLHFFPFTANVNNEPYKLSNTTFHITADKFKIVMNLSAINSSVPIVKEYLLFLSEKKMELKFMPEASNFSVAFVNAIELFTAPKGLIDNKTDGVNLTKTMMETVYRINVGGDLVTPFNDTVWRTWMNNDKKFLISPNLAINESYPSKINYPGDNTPPTPEFAPSFVYSTLEMMRLITEGDPTNNFNLT